MKNEKVLEVKNLSVSFKTPNGLVRAVRDVSLDLYKGETLAIVGESGSGKSVTNRAIMGILARNGIIDGGEINYRNQDLTKLSEENFHLIRGRKIGMIFQDPLSSLNPIMRIGKQITEAMLVNGDRIKNQYHDMYHKEYHDYLNMVASIHLADKELKNKVFELRFDKDITMKERKAKIHELKQIHHTSTKDFHHHLPELKKKYLAKKAEAKVETKKIKDQYIQERDQTIIDLKKQMVSKKSEEAQINKVNTQYLVQKKSALDEVNQIKATIKEFRQKVKEDLQEVKDDRVQVKAVKQKANLRFDELKKVYTEKKLSLKKVSKYTPEYQTYLEEVKKLRADIENSREQLKRKFKVTKKEAYETAIQIMKEVGIPEPELRFMQYPFQFSGGMRQRIVIAIALTANPELLICDEPTTALDVTIQGQILNLIKDIKKQRDLSVIFITHDLGVVANMADRLAVMYAGKIVEYGTIEDIFYNPKHPYTWALLSSVPDLDTKDKLLSIPGTPPDMLFPPKGDAFADRNQFALKIDFEEQPPFFKVSDTHYAATWLLHPDAPKIEMPSILQERVDRYKKQIQENRITNRLSKTAVTKTENVGEKK